jgi:hypothetical protein
MGIIEIGGRSQPFTARQRWSLFLALAFGAVALYVGVYLRDEALNATVTFVDSQTGIRAAYPENWLISTTGDAVFQVRDLATSGFKTTIRIAIRPINSDVTTERNVLDALTLRRAQTLPSYTVQSIEAYTLPNEEVGVRVDYTFVAVAENPFLESVPIVVQGVDILANRGGQALVISFQTDVSTYQENFAVFRRFLNSLEF